MNNRLPMMEPAGYHTHQPLLIAGMVLQNGKHPILELGAGMWSTMILHYATEAKKQLLITLESDSDWRNRFQPLQTNFHNIIAVDSWEKEIEQQIRQHKRFSLAFVDQSPAEARRASIIKLRPYCDIFVMHDTDLGWEPTFQVQEIIHSFKYRHHQRHVTPHTTIFSDVIPFSFNSNADHP